MLHIRHVTHEHFIDLKQIFMISQNFQNGVTNQLFLQKEITGLKFKLIAYDLKSYCSTILNLKICLGKSELSLQ